MPMRLLVAIEHWLVARQSGNIIDHEVICMYIGSMYECVESSVKFDIDKYCLPLKVADWGQYGNVSTGVLWTDL